MILMHHLQWVTLLKSKIFIIFFSIAAPENIHREEKKIEPVFVYDVHQLLITSQHGTYNFF